MLEISELAIPKSQKITTVCNGKREVWKDIVHLFKTSLIFSKTSAFSSDNVRKFSISRLSLSER